MKQTLLDIKNLKTYFYTDSGVVRAVDDVDLNIKAGTTLAIVGESGSGKSILASSIMQLIPKPPGKIVSGSIHFHERNLLELAEKEMRQVRGNKITMIFQEPMTSLNPVFRISRQIEEVIAVHRGAGREEARRQAVELLQLVGIPAAEERIKNFPHQLSGGMRQRVMIAIALACNPELLIADEPTTALDVTIQAQILELMRRLQEEYKMSIMMITHNLGVVSRMCDEVVVMYLGKIVEHADVRTLFHNPAHPYTQGLLNSIPKLGGRRSRLEPIKGVVPDPRAIPEGCSFRERCPVAMDICAQEPPVIDLDNKHSVRCWRFASQSMAERDAQ